MEERGEIIRDLESQLDMQKIRKNCKKSLEAPETIEKFKKKEAIAKQKQDEETFNKQQKWNCFRKKYIKYENS